MLFLRDCFLKIKYDFSVILLKKPEVNVTDISPQFILYAFRQ